MVFPTRFLKEQRFTNPTVRAARNRWLSIRKKPKGGSTSAPCQLPLLCNHPQATSIEASTMTSFPPSRLLLQRSPPAILVPPTFSSQSPPPRSLARLRRGEAGGSGRGEPERAGEEGRRARRGARVVARWWLLPVDPWAPAVDSESIASQLFALSLFPYLGFLYFLTKSKSAPSLTLFGFYFLLAFVGATSTCPKDCSVCAGLHYVRMWKFPFCFGCICLGFSCCSS